MCVCIFYIYIKKKKSVYIRTYIHTYKKKTLFVLLKKTKLICLFTRYRAFAQTRGPSRIEQVQSQASKTVIV